MISEQHRQLTRYTTCNKDNLNYERARKVNSEENRERMENNMVLDRTG